MKSIKVSPKLIELVKTNGKRFLCGVITVVALASPFTVLAEEKNEDVVTQEKIVEYIKNYNKEEVEFIVDGVSVKTTLDLSNPELTKEEIKEILDSLNALRPMTEYPSFFLVSHWEKSENYDNVKKENNEREYKRTISCFRASEKLNTNDYNNDIEKIGKDFRDDEKHEIFTIVGEKEEYILLTEEEEKELDTSKDIIMIEGSNIMFKIDAKEDERNPGLNIGILLLNSFNMARILSKKRDE